MKKLVYLLLAAFVLFCSCAKDEPLPECVKSAERVVYGNRIYSVEPVPDKGVFLTYTEIGDEEQTAYVGCVDPLCSHGKDECPAWSGAQGTPVAIVPMKKGAVVYFYRFIDGLVDPDDPEQGWETRTDLIAFDLSGGKCRTVTSVPARMPGETPFLIAGGYVYFTINSALFTGDYGAQYVNVWRAPTDGGELEQITFSEDMASAYRLEHYENGTFYFRWGDTLCRTSDDFATEKLVMEDLNLLWKIEIRDGWVYYSDEREVISLTPDEPKADNYAHVYHYAIGEYPEALDAANTCSLMRTRTDGSGVTEKLASGIATCPNRLAPNWCVIGSTLYCVPARFELQGTVEWGERSSPNSLSYIWSETCGDLLAIDLETGEQREALSDLGFDILSIMPAGDGRLLVSGRVYDLDLIREYVKTNEIHSSELRYTVWRLLDVD